VTREGGHRPLLPGCARPSPSACPRRAPASWKRASSSCHWSPCLR
jgi:hypothetical protein